MGEEFCDFTTPSRRALNVRVNIVKTPLSAIPRSSLGTVYRRNGKTIDLNKMSNKEGKRIAKEQELERTKEMKRRAKEEERREKEKEKEIEKKEKETKKEIEKKEKEEMKARKKAELE